MIGYMLCFHYFLFIYIADKEYFLVWRVVKFKAFRASFCLTPPTIIEVSHVVAFLCMY